MTGCPSVHWREDGQPSALSLPDYDYWLFDSRDLWIMQYDGDGRFLYAEQADDPVQIIEYNYWRDKALHPAVSSPDWALTVPTRATRISATRACMACRPCWV